MTKQEYLYGEDVELEPIPEDIAMRRIEALKDHLSELLDHSYHTRDGRRINAILKAISFWSHINDDIETI